MSFLDRGRARPARALSASTLRPVVQMMQAAGVRAAELRGEVPFDVDVAVARDRWLPSTLSDAVWGAGVRHVGDELPLRIASSIEPRTYGHLTYLIASSATVGDAIQRLTRYYGLISDAATYHVDIGARGVLVALEIRGAERPPCVESFLIAAVWCFLDRYALHASAPREVRLAQREPSGALRTAHERTFGCRVSFGQRGAGLVLHREQLASPMRAADPALAELLEDYAGTLMARRAPRGCAEQVRDRIAAHGSHLGLASRQVAASLGMSDRSLRRMLRADGTTFRAELEAVLARVARERLAEHSVEHVAAELGYADAAAFRRAFRRWYGAPPRGCVGLARRLSPPRRSN